MRTYIFFFFLRYTLLYPRVQIWSQFKRKTSKSIQIHKHIHYTGPALGEGNQGAWKKGGALKVLKNELKNNKHRYFLQNIEKLGLRLNVYFI